MSNKVSVIIPARKEPYLRETIQDVMNHAQDEIEVIVLLDGWEPDFKLPRRKGLKTIRNPKPIGMRPCINKAAKIATGDYLMKLDAHCSIGEGWDAMMKADHEENCITVPRRYRWDAPAWDFWKDKFGNVDVNDRMEYIYPFTRPYFPRLTGRPNKWKAEQRIDIEIDEDMTFQGSCWFMTREHFTDRLCGMATEGYGTFGEEPQEIGLKTQLGPWKGKILRNKKTWYAHWSKPGIHWRLPAGVAGRAPDAEREQSYVYSWDHWWNNRWTERIHDFEWLVEKFWPLKGWPENWKWETRQFDRFDLSELWPTLRLR